MSIQTVDRPVIQASDSAAEERYAAERTAPRVPLLTPEKRDGMRVWKMRILMERAAEGLYPSNNNVQDTAKFCAWLEAGMTGSPKTGGLTPEQHALVAAEYVAHGVTQWQH